jgi:hypothetical protein
MFTAEQYRAKAAEYRKLLEGSRSPAETREFLNLEQTFTLLADNEEWLRRNAAKIVSAEQNDSVPASE